MDEDLLKVKEALSVFVKASRRIDKLLDIRAELYARAVYKSPSMERIGTYNAHIPDKFVEGLAKVDKIEREIDNTASTYSEKHDYVINLINKLDPEYNMMIVLQWRYINGKPWEYIADKLGLTVSYVHRLHRQGLEALKDKI